VTDPTVSTAAGVPAAAERTVKILHLSDLHFGTTFDPSLWDYVAKVLAGADRPNIIVVTGDLVDTPSFFMLGLARNELEALRHGWCASGHECELLVIPGNHDVGILGNLAIWPWSSKFRIVFGGDYRALFDRLPKFTEYIRRPWWSRWARRTAWTICFALRRVSFTLRQPPPPQRLVSECTGGALCIARFDSNCKLRLASGYISASDISKVHGELLQRRLPSEGKLLNLVPRIALVHHHVVAIPYSSTIEGLTEFEPFLTLRNAGTLLRELCFWDFDLVLHGHKHLLNFVRLTFDSADQPRSEIAVLAAGSATKRQTLAGQNSFNLIKVYRSGCITYRSVRYGQGASGEVESPWSTGFQRLLPLNEMKLRAWSRARAGQEISCDSLEFGYRINERGSARCERQVRGLRGLHEERVRRRQQAFTVSFGAVSGRSVRLTEESVLAGHVLSPVTDAAVKRINVEVMLTGQRLTADVGTDFGLKWRAINSFATSYWECLAMGMADGRDWMSVFVRLPCKRLKLAAHLPDTFRNPSPQVRVHRCAEYPLMQVDAQGDVELNANTTWEIDPDLTDLERPNVRVVGNRCELEVEYPLVGHTYELRWRVDTAVGPTTPERRGLTQQIRRTLLKLAHPNTPKAEELAALANEMLQKTTEQVIQALLGSSYSLEEQLDCALFIYNEDGQCFDLVAEGRTRAPGPLVVKRIPLNAGISGAAFKNRGVSLYICESCRGPDEDGPYVYFPEDAPTDNRPDYAALLAIPMTLQDLTGGAAAAPAPGARPDEPDVPVTPDELIGVFTIASTARDNRLLSLAGTRAEPGNIQQKHQLVVELWTVAARYMLGLSDAVRTAVRPG
jgi:3',5'-cyclic AMP phosphodiesterase CpdA